MIFTGAILRRAGRFAAAPLAAMAALALNGCYQSSLKETPPVRFTQDQLGQPLENLLGDPKDGADNESTVEAYPASLETAASPSRSG